MKKHYIDRQVEVVVEGLTNLAHAEHFQQAYFDFLRSQYTGAVIDLSRAKPSIDVNRKSFDSAVLSILMKFHEIVAERGGSLEIRLKKENSEFLSLYNGSELAGEDTCFRFFN